MKFRTEIEPDRKQGFLSHTDKILLLGSCFTTSVGERLLSDGFDALINPFGALYNPASILQALQRIADGHPFEASEAVSHDGLYHSFLSHSALSAPSIDEFLERHNAELRSANAFLQRATAVIITLGTAWVYTLRSSAVIVANCHKLPAATFCRSRLNSDSCARIIDEIISLLRSINPTMKVIFTVSPIRHIADGLHGNMLSKSTLLLAIDNATGNPTVNPTVNSTGILYFPSFEIMLDDLRDYRFYDADMRHPSPVAVEYIYSTFAETYFTPTTTAAAAEFHKLFTRTRHRVINSADPATAEFATKTESMAREMALRHPELKDSIYRLCHID